MRVHFARHGESEANLLRAFHNRDSRHPLTAKGRAQAAQLARRMQAEGVTAIHASPIARAQETAVIVGEALGLPIVTEHGLRECDVGVIEGQTYEQAFDAYQRVKDAWLAGRLDARFEDGESASEIVARIAGILDRLRATAGDGASVLLVGHGDAMSIALRHLVVGLATPATLGHCESVAAELKGQVFVAR